MERNHVSNNLLEMRKNFGYTQQNLADVVEVSRQTIISIEKGSYTPSVLLALKIGEALSCSVEEIFTINK